MTDGKVPRAWQSSYISHMIILCARVGHPTCPHWRSGQFFLQTIAFDVRIYNDEYWVAWSNRKRRLSALRVRFHSFGFFASSGAIPGLDSSPRKSNISPKA